MVICYVLLRPVCQAVTVVSVSVLSCQSVVVPLHDTSNVPGPRPRTFTPRNVLGVTAAAACYGTYAREISLLVLLLPRGQQE